MADEVQGLKLYSATLNMELIVYFTWPCPDVPAEIYQVEITKNDDKKTKEFIKLNQLTEYRSNPRLGTIVNPKYEEVLGSSTQIEYYKDGNKSTNGKTEYENIE